MTEPEPAPMRLNRPTLRVVRLTQRGGLLERPAFLGSLTGRPLPQVLAQLTERR